MRWWAAALVVACRAASAPPVVVEPPRPKPVAQAPSPFPEVSPFRLPHTFEPKQYRLRIALGETRFTGHVEIEGELSEAVSLIWLHGVDLVVTRARAIGAAGAVDLAFSAPRSDQVLGFRSEHELPPGKWTLAIDYEGPIRELQPQVTDARFPGKVDAWATGVFRRVAGGRSYVYTQGEAIYARQIVPCIDEPDRKVPWQLTLDVASDAIAASTAPIARETPLDKKHKRVEFAETRPLPSYLLAFAVGPFDVIDGGRTRSGVPIRVLVQKGHAGNAAWAAPEIRRVLDFLEDYLAAPYPYGKLDVVSVPHSGWSAMENPGLVTFDTHALEESHARTVLAHELAHQWFGDLVTPAWWDDIWLNESFAQWMADKIELHLAGGDDDRIELRTRGLEAGGPSVRQAADTLASLQRGNVAPWEAIAKGASLLALIESHLGPARFRDALRAYVVEQADRVVTTAELSATLDRFASAPLVLAQRLEHGLEIVDGTLVCEANRARFDLGHLSLPTRVCVAYDRDRHRATTCTVVAEQARSIDLPARMCPQWVLPNADAEGMYRVGWTENIVKGLLAHGWPSLTRDERRMMFEGITDPVLELELFERLVQEGDPPPLRQTAPYLTSMAKYVPDDLMQRFDEWIDAHYASRAHAISLEPDAPFTSLEDRLALDLVALTGDPELAARAKPLAARYLTLPAQYPWLDPVLALAARQDPAFRDRLLDDIAHHPPEQAWRAFSALHALSEVPGTGAALVADPVRLRSLDRWARASVLASTCDAKTLGDLRALDASQPDLKLGHQVQVVEHCVADKAKLDPIFRAWLARPASTGSRP